MDNKREDFYKIFKYKFLLSASIVTGIIQLIYFIQYIIAHDLSGLFPFYVIPLLLIGLVVSVITYLKVKADNLPLASILMVIQTVIVLPILIASAGGLKAPGLQWLTVIPIIFVTFYEKKGMIYGVLFLFFIVGFFLLFPFETYMSPEIYFRQKIINFFIYACFIIVFFYSYVSTIKTYEESLHKKSLKIDYLLKTLLHDVSNPVQILSLLLPRFKQGIDDESYDKLWRNHQAIVNIIKDVQRLEGSSSDEKLVREEISCKELLDKAKLRQSEALESKSINLIIENQLGDELINVSPSIFINQILNNLITNAIKFSDDGKDIILKAFRKNSSIFFEVRDYGVGIEEAKVKSLFDIYSVSSTAGTNGEQGTGFGLPLVKYYLDQHQGEIKVDSAPFSDRIDQGTSFLIRLPVT